MNFNKIALVTGLAGGISVSSFFSPANAATFFDCNGSGQANQGSSCLLNDLTKNAGSSITVGDKKWFFVTWYGSIGGHKSTKSLSGKRLN